MQFVGWKYANAIDLLRLFIESTFGGYEKHASVCSSCEGHSAAPQCESRDSGSFRCVHSLRPKPAVWRRRGWNRRSFRCLWSYRKRRYAQAQWPVLRFCLCEVQVTGRRGPRRKERFFVARRAGSHCATVLFEEAKPWRRRRTSIEAAKVGYDLSLMFAEDRLSYTYVCIYWIINICMLCTKWRCTKHALHKMTLYKVCKS